tara:strand:- start:2633 stop:4213 length:1581 start_codon:yes stop_codon:yes gene_type:complete
MSIMQANIQFLSSSNSFLPNKFQEHKNFGVLTLTTPEQSSQNAAPKNYHVTLTLDRSGSMEDITPSDSTSKIAQVKMICKNIVKWMNKDTNQYSITIILFDFEVITLVENKLITKTNEAQIIEYIDSIYSRGNTNIEQALKESHKLIKQHNNPELENIHIFMTDGLPTTGERNHKQLEKIILEHKLENIGTEHFIGFGENHDGHLLENFAKIYDDNYHFIDSYETGGMVYGEILSDIIYSFSNNIILTGNNLKLYDYKTNTWVESLTIHRLSYHTTKTFYILKNGDILSMFTSDSATTSRISLSTESMLSINNNATIWYENIEEPTKKTTFINHLWRFTVLQLLYNIQEEDINESGIQETLKELKDYMKTTNQEEESFLKILCDDLYITNKVKNTSYKHIYIHNRQISQGEQRGYTVKNVDHIMSDDWEDIDTFHELSQDSSTPFASVQKRTLSRSVSGNPKENKRLHIPPRTSIALDDPPAPLKVTMPKLNQRSKTISRSNSSTKSSTTPSIKNPEIPDYSNMHS